MDSDGGAWSITLRYEGADSPREREVGLEAELARVGRVHLAVVERVAGDERAVEHRLDEELGVEVGRRRIEGRAGNRLARE